MVAIVLAVVVLVVVLYTVLISVIVFLRRYEEISFHKNKSDKLTTMHPSGGRTDERTN